jgi:ribosomal protein S27E
MKSWANHGPMASARQNDMEQERIVVASAQSDDRWQNFFCSVQCPGCISKYRVHRCARPIKCPSCFERLKLPDRLKFSEVAPVEVLCTSCGEHWPVQPGYTAFICTCTALVHTLGQGQKGSGLTVRVMYLTWSFIKCKYIGHSDQKGHYADKPTM